MTQADRSTPEGKGLARILARASDEGYAAASDALANADCRAADAQVTAPTIVAYGTEDKAAPRAASEALAAAIAGARLRPIDGAAHLPLLHYPEASSAILNELT